MVSVLLCGDLRALRLLYAYCKALVKKPPFTLSPTFYIRKVLSQATIERKYRAYIEGSRNIWRSIT